MIYAHRGASAYAPENTLPAFQLAVEQGADGIELDVHLSADGHLVVIHDEKVDKTTDSIGAVAAMTLVQLQALDAGSWKEPRYANTRIPTLDEVFAAVGSKLLVNVEIKHTGRGIEEAVAACIHRHDMAGRVLISSFEPQALAKFRAVMPDVPIGYLYSSGEPENTRLDFDAFPYEVLHPYHALIDADYMTWARSLGVQVNTWTVNDPERAVVLRDLGVNIIITDIPDVIKAALG